MTKIDRINFVLLCMLGVAATETSANAACEVQIYQTTNLCTTSSKIQLDPSVGFPNDFWSASFNGTGLSEAFATLTCHNAGVNATLYHGIVANSDYFECGQGSAINYPVVRQSNCGTDSTC
jgi:hypothetical protein